MAATETLIFAFVHFITASTVVLHQTSVTVSMTAPHYHAFLLDMAASDIVN